MTVLNTSITATLYYANPPTSEGINRSCYYPFISLTNIFCNTRRYSLHKKKMVEKNYSGMQIESQEAVCYAPFSRQKCQTPRAVTFIMVT